ncbi:hypothetical protein ACFVVQ_13910 [Paenibacillus chitinolyticus]|uniref:hypothetical protein n=1 Tax=Paenibacillus chitinolyticus TaxID=79263 RepID=UPI0036D7DFA4
MKTCLCDQPILPRETPLGRCGRSGPRTSGIGTKRDGATDEAESSPAWLACGVAAMAERSRAAG